VYIVQYIDAGLSYRVSR